MIDIFGKLPAVLTTVAGKSVRALVRLRGSSGSALPGLVVEKINPKFLSQTLAKLPYGVVVISGTNGKTTTTKMVVEMLSGQGLKVFTNRSGSNFTRGVVASLLAELNFCSQLDADIAVLELDEAHAVHFIEQVTPSHVLLLNVMRDQLDRFGEIDYTASLLAKLAASTSKTLTLNREDHRIRALSSKAQNGVKVEYFGLAEKLLDNFPNDEQLHYQGSEAVDLATLVQLEEFTQKAASFRIGDETLTTELKLSGAYNIFNAAAALALVKQIMAESLNIDQLIKSLATVTPAFGRGEIITVDERQVELVLVKNPAGFRLSLSSFPAAGVRTLIAINDKYADGRDMSWLWDVDFNSLADTGVSLVSGSRCYDMALRLQLDGVEVGSIEPDLSSALKKMLAEPGDIRIFTTYTAMLELRKVLAEITDVKGIDE